MIHTLEFYVNVTAINKELIERKHRQNIKAVVKKLQRQFSKFNIRIGKKLWNRSYNIYLQFDAVDLLERTEDGVINSKEWEVIQFYIQELEQQLFNSTDLHFILNRIDYRVDLKVENEEHRKILFKLWRKIAKGYGHLKKRTKKSTTREKINKKDIYTSEKAYQTTIYLASKSIVVCLYDKEEERKSKGIEPLLYEKDVIRFEVRLMRNHLAYKAREKKQDKSKKKKVVRQRSLEAYMQRECFIEYIQKYVLDIFLTEDFHKLNVIKAKLIEAGINDTKRDKLIDFINIIARTGVEGAIGYRKEKINKGNKDEEDREINKDNSDNKDEEDKKINKNNSDNKDEENKKINKDNRDNKDKKINKDNRDNKDKKINKDDSDNKGKKSNRDSKDEEDRKSNSDSKDKEDKRSNKSSKDKEDKRSNKSSKDKEDKKSNKSSKDKEDKRSNKSSKDKRDKKSNKDNKDSKDDKDEKDEKNKKKGGYSRYTMKKYSQILRELGIHIISLPIKTRGAGDILENPLRKWKIDNV